jgi:hypothetical protein
MYLPGFTLVFDDSSIDEFRQMYLVERNIDAFSLLTN